MGGSRAEVLVSITDPATVMLLCRPLEPSDERPFSVLSIVEQELGESLPYVVDSPVPRRLEDRRSYIRSYFQEGRDIPSHAPKAGSRLPLFSNGKEEELQILVSGGSGPSGAGFQHQLRIHISFPRQLANPRGDSLLAHLAPAMEAWWGRLSFLDFANVTGGQYLNPLDPKPPPEGLPRLTPPHLLDSVARPYQLGWLNYWSDEAARLAGFDENRDLAVVAGVRRIPDRGWIIQLTKEPLDLSRPEHRAQFSAAYERFRGVGRVPEILE